MNVVMQKPKRTIRSLVPRTVAQRSHHPISKIQLEVWAKTGQTVGLIYLHCLLKATPLETGSHVTCQSKGGKSIEPKVAMGSMTEMQKGHEIRPNLQ